MNRDELFRRTKAILHPELALRQAFLIIGVGSGGARVAEEVVRFGAGRVILLDRPGELLEEHNIIRHPLGYAALRRPKTEALRDRLLDINPQCDVQTVAMDVVAESQRLEDLVRGCTQVHLCTDNEPSKHAVNAIAVRTGATLILGGVYDGGCGGEVGRVVPGGACYACMAAFLNRELNDSRAPETFDYSNPDREQFRSTAALNIDIAQIALIQARVALCIMREAAGEKAELEGNYILFGNRSVDGLFPRMLCSEIWHIPRDPECLVCGATADVAAMADAAAEILVSAHCGSAGGDA